jgi:hypothetical protein
MTTSAASTHDDQESPDAQNEAEQRTPGKEGGRAYRD